MTRRVLVILFWLLAAFTVGDALAPARQALHLFHWDKLEHAVAFGVLSVFARCAFPRVSPLWLGLGLSGLGAAIEILQGTPFIGRDADISDWVADTIAIVVVLGAIDVGRRLARAF